MYRSAYNSPEIKFLKCTNDFSGKVVSTEGGKIRIVDDAFQVIDVSNKHRTEAQNHWGFLRNVSFGIGFAGIGTAGYSGYKANEQTDNRSLWASAAVVVGGIAILSLYRGFRAWYEKSEWDDNISEIVEKRKKCGVDKTGFNHAYSMGLLKEGIVGPIEISLLWHRTMRAFVEENDDLSQGSPKASAFIKDFIANAPLERSHLRHAGVEIQYNPLVALFAQAKTSYLDVQDTHALRSDNNKLNRRVTDGEIRETRRDCQDLLNEVIPKKTVGNLVGSLLLNQGAAVAHVHAAHEYQSKKQELNNIFLTSLIQRVKPKIDDTLGKYTDITEELFKSASREGSPI